MQRFDSLAYTRLQLLRAVGSDSLLNANNQLESEDNDTDADRTVLYDVDENDAIEPPTAATDAIVCCNVSCGYSCARWSSAFLYILCQ